MYLACLVQVTALSALSRFGNFLLLQPTLVPVFRMADEIYNTARIEYLHYDDLHIHRVGAATVAITTTAHMPAKTIRIAPTTITTISTPTTARITVTTSTITSNITTTTTITPADNTASTTIQFVAESVTRVFELFASESRSRCDWFFVYSTGKELQTPYNLTSKTEMINLRNAVSQARMNRRTLEQIAKKRPEQAARAIGLRDVLDYLVSAPLGSFCVAFLDLQRQLVPYTISKFPEKNSAELGALFDGAVARVLHDDLHTHTKPRLGLLSPSAEEALAFVLEENWGDEKYCFGDDCDWPVCIYDMRKVSHWSFSPSHLRMPIFCSCCSLSSGNSE
ncbi:hypothetical protein F5Y12DRAFT_731457 [Xylaria sp. FL1777]|nr:hypothetical protein F5Y12DRAFT_731457 [Xylaria sp. FL1777]